MTTISPHLHTRLLKVADILIPASATMPGLGTVDPNGEWLGRAAAARPDLLERVPAVLEGLNSEVDLAAALQRLFVEDRSNFDTLATLVAGAYFMTPEVRSRIGYPGPGRHPATTEEVVEDLADIIEQANSYRPRGTDRQ